MSEGGFTFPAYPEMDFDLILEDNRPEKIARRRHPRPADLLPFVPGHNAQTQRPEEGVLGLFHVAEQAREMNDAGHIGLGELNTSFGSEFVGH